MTENSKLVAMINEYAAEAMDLLNCFVDEMRENKVEPGDTLEPLSICIVHILGNFAASLPFDEEGPENALAIRQEILRDICKSAQDLLVPGSIVGDGETLH